jgi:hypothetical protein
LSDQDLLVAALASVATQAHGNGVDYDDVTCDVRVDRHHDVLNNARKHGLRLPTCTPDPFSSARWFRRWREEHRRPLRSPPVVEAWSWDPWSTISLDEVPGRRAESWSFEDLLGTHPRG